MRFNALTVLTLFLGLPDPTTHKPCVNKSKQSREKSWSGHPHLWMNRLPYPNKLPLPKPWTSFLTFRAPRKEKPHPPLGNVPQSPEEPLGEGLCAFLTDIFSHRLNDREQIDLSGEWELSRDPSGVGRKENWQEG